DFEGDIDVRRWLPPARNDVGKLTTLVRRARREIRVEKRAKRRTRLQGLERHAKDRLCIGFGNQFACGFILCAGFAWKHEQGSQKNQTYGKAPKRCRIKSSQHH